MAQRQEPRAMTIWRSLNFCVRPPPLPRYVRGHREPLAVLFRPAIGVAAMGLLAVGRGVAGGGVDDGGNRRAPRILTSCAVKFLIVTGTAVCFRNAARSTSDCRGSETDRSAGDDKNLTAQDVKIRVLGDFAIIHAATSYTTARCASRRMGATPIAGPKQNGKWLAVSAHVSR